MAAISTFSAIYIVLSDTRLSTSKYVLLDVLSSTKLIGYLTYLPSLYYVIDLLQIKLQTRFKFCTKEQCASLVLLIVSFISLFLSAASHTFLGFVVGFSFAYIVLRILNYKLKVKNAQRILSTMPDVFRTLSLSLSSGRSLAQSIEYVGVSHKGIVADEFLRCAMCIRCGMPIKDSLVMLEERLDVPGMQMLVCGLTISQRTGSPLQSLFLKCAHLIEEEASLQQTLKAKTAQVRVSVKIVNIIPIAILMILCLISPEFRCGITSFNGMVCLGVAAVLDVVAILIIKKMVGSVI